MRVYCFVNNAISLLILAFAMTNTNCENKTKIPEKTNDSLGFWMSATGNIQENLMNIQAIIVKDENTKGQCGSADRRSTTIHLMCAGSILNRNIVITSATCIHIATHIRHNIRGILSVAIAPLNPNMQVIKVVEYKVNLAHEANPYSSKFIKHNIAMLKLGCRINMEILHKIELPRAPFANSCEEDNCIVMVYRRMKKARWVMNQILAPQVPVQNRRRKETMMKDGDFGKVLGNESVSSEKSANKRAKRKLAERPDFSSHYEKRNQSEKRFESSTNIRENSSMSLTTKIMDETMKNFNVSSIISLEDIAREDRSGPISNETIRSFVVRSSDGYRGCTQSGAPVMLNHTQLAIVSAPCDDRQPWRRWGYTDLYDNLDWISETLKNWNPPISPATEPPSPARGGDNKTACSSCIFNFFIDFGCKKNANGKCAGRVKDGTSLNVHTARKSINGSGPRQRKKKVDWKSSQSCQRNIYGNPAFARGCSKRVDASATIAEDPPALFDRPGPEMARYLQRSANDDTSGPRYSPRSPNDDTSGLEKAATVGPIETPFRDDLKDNEDEFARGNDRPPTSHGSWPKSPNPESTKMSFDRKNERANNEIALQHIEDDSADWLAEDNKDAAINRGIEAKFDRSQRSFEKNRWH